MDGHWASCCRTLVSIIRLLPEILPRKSKPAPTFSEYSMGQQKFSETEEYKKMEQYWTGKFRQSVPVLDIPTDFPRPEERTYKSHRLDFPLESELVAGIKKMGARYGCSLVTTLMAAFEVFLHRLTDQQEIVLGIPAAGQSLAGLYGLVGHCVNLLPMRSRPEGIILFAEYLKQRKPQILGDYEHQQITFGSLLQKLNIPRDRSRVPLVPVISMLNSDSMKELNFQGLKYEMVYNSESMRILKFH